MLSNIGNIFMMEHNLFRGEQKLSIFFIHFTSLIKTILTSSENKENIDPMNFLITSLQEFICIIFAGRSIYLRLVFFLDSPQHQNKS